MTAIPWPEEEKLTIRKCLDQAKTLIAQVASILSSRARSLESKVASLHPDTRQTFYHAAVPLIEAGGRVVFSSINCNHLPQGNVNQIAQEL